MKKLILFSLISLLTLSVNSQERYQSSEYAPAELILLHEPGTELHLGMLHPQAALFEKYFNLDKSREEHKNYVKELNKRDIKTLLVRDVLLHGCTDANGKTLENNNVKALRRFAFDVLNYDVSGLPKEKQGEQNKYKQECIAALSAQELVDIIILRPTVFLSETKDNTGIAARYEYAPLMNLFYTRDQSITTPRGIVMCRLSSPQRGAESDVIRFCYEKLGFNPILEVGGKGAYLEGGDYLLTDNTSYIGCGMRTSQEAINQIMMADAFGTDRVVVVKDVRKYQAEMHLDTYFNIIDKDLVTLGEERMNAQKGDDTYVCVDVFEKNSDGNYQQTVKDLSFVEFLHSERMNIIVVTPEDQARLANNFLTIAPRVIMAVDGQSDTFKAALSAAGVDVTWLPLWNLTKGYGAAHCMTQVIRRK